MALPGSLRQASTNRTLLLAASRLAPPELLIEVYDRIGELPHFNPDLDQPDESLPPAVRAFRAMIANSDGLLIASPEYAHGIPGSFKNALDWLVSGPEIPEKPVALFHATQRGTHARAALHEVLSTMSARLIDDASVAVALLGTATDPATIAANPAQAAQVRFGLSRFAAAIRALDADGSAQLHARP